MATKSNDKGNEKSKTPAKTTIKDLPVRKADADKVKGGAGSAGYEVLR